MDILKISPDVILARERRRWQKGVFLFLALAVAVMTVILLINPAATEEYKPICGFIEHTHSPECFEVGARLVCETPEEPGHVHDGSCYETVRTVICGLDGDEEHEHAPECFAEERVLVCTLPEDEVHEHTEYCVSWEEVPVCGSEDDPEHVHDETCWQTVPVFICEAEPGVGHIHNSFCYLEEEILTCTIPEHEHKDACYPKLTGDPHADVEIELDWYTTLNTVQLTGNWADDLVSIAQTQIGYAESERNFVTDEYNVMHGYTRYGEWYGTRYAGWNAIYVMFCLHYAEIRGVPTDPVPSNWMNAARAQGFWGEADCEPLKGDLVFFDDDADGLADRIAIVEDVYEDGITVILGGTQVPVHEEDFPRDFANIAGYLLLPENPDPPAPDEDFVTIELPGEENLPADIPVDEELPEKSPFADFADTIILRASTADGITVTLTAPWETFPYPAEELRLTAEPVNSEDCGGTMEAIENELNESGRTTAAAQLLDITVWRAQWEREDVIDPDLTGEWIAADMISVEPIFADAQLTVEDDVQSSDAAYNEATDEAVIKANAETKTEWTVLRPMGSYEITVEGMDGAEDGMQVWHVNGEGLEELRPEHMGRRVTVILGAD